MTTTERTAHTGVVEYSRGVARPWRHVLRGTFCYCRTGANYGYRKRRHCQVPQGAPPSKFPPLSCPLSDVYSTPVHTFQRDLGGLFNGCCLRVEAEAPLQIHARLNATFKCGVTRPLAYRRKQLLQLARLLQDNIAAIEDAELKDLGKPRQEVMTIELSTVIRSCLHAAEHLEEWARPEKPIVEEWRSSWDTTIYKVPKGVALIISYVSPTPHDYVVLRIRPSGPGTILSFCHSTHLLGQLQLGARRY